MSRVGKMWVLGAAVLLLMVVVMMGVIGVMAAGTLITVENVDQTELGVVTAVQFVADVPADANLAAFTIEVTFDETIATFAADALDGSDSSFSLACNPNGNKVICSGFNVNGFTDETVNLFSLPFRCVQAGVLPFSAGTLNLITFTDQNGVTIDTMFDDGALRCLAPTPTYTPLPMATSTPSMTPTNTAIPPTLTNTPTLTPTATTPPTETPTLTPTQTIPTPTATQTATLPPTDTPLPSPSPTPTISPSTTAIATVMQPENTVVPATATLTATAVPSIEPTPTRTNTPISPTITPIPTVDSTPVPGTVGTINGIIFNDTNQNGMYEPNLGESGLDGVAITLFSDTGLMRETDTRSGGIYQFDDLPMGQLYTVQVGIMTLPIDITAQTTTGADSGGGIAAVVALSAPPDSPTTVTLPIRITESFGFIPAEPTSVTLTRHTLSTRAISVVHIGFIVVTSLTIFYYLKMSVLDND